MEAVQQREAFWKGVYANDKVILSNVLSFELINFKISSCHNLLHIAWQIIAEMEAALKEVADVAILQVFHN